MLGDMIRKATAVYKDGRPLFLRALVDLRSNPLPDGIPLPTIHNTIRFTNLQYSVKWQTSRAVNKRHKPFLLKSDLFYNEAMPRFSDLEDLKKQAEKDIRIEFIMKNTNISEDILRIAKQLIQKEVPLCFDVVKYDRMIREKIESRTGKKYDGPVFISEEMNEAEKARKEQYDIDFSEACRERERLKTKERRKEKEAMDNE